MRKLAAALILAASLALPSAAGAELLVADDRLWLVSDDGATRTAVPGRGSDPAWAPDGQRFAMTTSIGDDRTELTIGSIDSEQRVTLAGGDGLDDPSWSPDGQTLAATRLRIGRGENATYTSELVLVPAAGGPPRVLTSGRIDAGPAWSPDGTEIAFARTVLDPVRGTAERTLMAIRPDGSGLRRIAGEGGDPAWSPDGRQLAFSSVRDRNGQTCFHDCSPNGELYVVGADGSGERRLTTTEADEGGPAWSPDGTRIAFASDRHYPRGRSPEVFVMDADGSCVTQLTFGSGSPRAPAWRPGAAPVGRGPCGVRLAPFHDDIDVARVRVRDAVTLYPGRSFEGMRLNHAENGLIVLDECDLPDPERCIGEIQLQATPVCRRNPAIYDIPVRRLFRMRGALVVDYGNEGFDVMSGGTTTAVWGIRSVAMLRRFVAALRPVSGPENLDRRLPAARLPRKAWRDLRRSARLRRDPIVVPRSEIVRSDRRVLRAFRRHGSPKRPACD